MNATFDHRDAGTPESAWLPELDSLPRLKAPTGTLIVIAAHPDDESLGAGGLIAAASAYGADVRVVVASDGEASHPESGTVRPDELAATRRDEVRAAIAHLAPTAIVDFLHLPDGRLAEHEDDIVAAVGHRPPSGKALVVAPWRGDRHPDHEACARAAERIAHRHEASLWQYPIWAWHWANPHSGELPTERMRRLDLDEAACVAKKVALAEHVSQHTALSAADGDEPILPPSVLAHFERAFECFVLPAPAAQPAYFTSLYAGRDDPWGLADRFYEQRKRSIVLGSLPRPSFARVFEPGCATGLLTKALAERAEQVVAWDVASAALHQTSTRLGASLDRVRIERGQIPLDWPDGEFDLIVLSEVGYYCDDMDLLVRRVLASLTSDGVVLGCHWARAAVDHPRDGRDVHDAFDRVLPRLVHHVEDDFRLDVWTRSGKSVASAEGIV